MSEFYILDENKKVIPATREEWSNFRENLENKIVKQENVGEHCVSTVFIGLDHDFLEDYPHIFEIRIFKGNVPTLYCDRHLTWEQAIAGHEKAVKIAQESKVEEKDE
jgi:hypothetical protein